MASQKSKSPRFRRWFRMAGILGGIGLAAFLVIILIYIFLARRYDLQDVGRIPERSVVFDFKDKLYSRIGSENREVVTLDQVSPLFVSALLAREDTRFYDHHGVDLQGILRATVRNTTALSIREGGSTITQQLARNSFPLGRQGFHRKLLEAMVSMRMERCYTKDQILEAYVNRIYFGSGVYGIETASQAYFGKPARDLDLSEAALLAGIIRSPNRFSPFHNLKAAVGQRNDVLDRMEKLGRITHTEYLKAHAAAIKLAPRQSLPLHENHAVDAIRQEMEACLSEEELGHAGFRIYTTLDPNLQESAARALAIQLNEVESRKGYPHPKRAAPLKSKATPEMAKTNTDYLQGAVVVMDHLTGGIRAMVGSRDYRDSRFNRALHARRQVGSSFKPFIYTAAFQEGLSPDEKIDDGPIAPDEFKVVGDPWSPVNSDGKSMGIQPAAEGLIHSRNTMSVRVGQHVGVERTRDMAALLNLGSDILPVPSLYLGAFESTLKDMTAAYTIFPNGGLLKQSHLIRRIEDEEGVVLYEAQPARYPVFERDATRTTSEILEKVMERGTAASAHSLGLNRRGAGKTGTTNEYRDAWFIGYTHSLTCGVWVGFDQPKTIMKRGYGSTLALPVWVEIVSKASEEDYPDGDLDVSEDWERPAEARREEEEKGDDIFSRMGRSLGRIFGGD